MTWYNKIVQDLSNIPDALEYYEGELIDAKKDVKIKGILEKNSSELPGVVEHRFNQLQEIEAILQFLNIQLRKVRRKHFKSYLENYQRALTSRDVEKYVDGEDEIADFQHLVNEFALMRNRFHGLIKALDAKQFQINNIVKLRVAGLEDIGV